MLAHLADRGAEVRQRVAANDQRARVRLLRRKDLDAVPCPRRSYGGRPNRGGRGAAADGGVSNCRSAFVGKVLSEMLLILEDMQCVNGIGDRTGPFSAMDRSRCIDASVIRP